MKPIGNAITDIMSPIRTAALSRGEFTVRVVIAVFLCALAQTSAMSQTRALPVAHAHNDYRHERPLIDALSHGFCGVEADVFLVNDQLLVGHEPSELEPSRTLQNLYLDPLRERVNRNGGRVYPDGPTIMLLIDFKSEGAKTYEVLDKVLESYRDIVSSDINGVHHRGAVEIVISGDRPIEMIADDDARYAGIDGRLPDLTSTDAANLMPLISDRWTSHFSWRGEGNFPADQRKKLHEIVQQAHRSGRRVRFWATPESPALWKELLQAKVDHINTDELKMLKDFLETK